MQRVRATVKRPVCAAALLVILALPAGSWARPTHGAIEALDVGADLDGREYDPVPVGATWTYREPESGARSRQVIARGATVLYQGSRPPEVLRTREAYELEGEGGRIVERMVLDPEAEAGVSVVAAEVIATGRPAMTLPEPALEMPRHLRAGSEWKAWGVLPSKVLGLADVTVQAGDFARCLVIEETGGHRLPDGSKADVRRFFAPKVGEVLAVVFAADAWRPARELVEWGVYPSSATTLQPPPKP